ncbi:MAG: DUF4007 family protein [Cyanobacteriota bacterium]
MPINPLPQNPLKKAALRHLLTQSQSPNPSAKSPSAAALRNARYWAVVANLLNEQGVTPEGKLVITKDPYLEATVTDWLIHFHLSFGDRSLCQSFVFDFLPKHSEFTQDELSSYFTNVFSAESSDSLNKITRSILKTYTDSEAIAKNQFLIYSQKTYSIGNPDLSNPYMTGYLLAKIWEQDFKSRPAVLVDDILNARMGLSSLLGIKKDQLRQQLDILARYEVIEQRSAKPHFPDTKPPIKEDGESSYLVFRCWKTPDELLEKAYKNDSATPNQPLIQSLSSILDDDEDVPDFSSFLEWATVFISLDGGSNTITRFAS